MAGQSEEAVDGRSVSTAANPDMVQDLLVEQLQDLLHAEGQLVKALPKMETAANDPQLKEAFAVHLEETVLHVERLKEVFVLIGADVESKTCKGMAGLLEEGNEVIENGEEKDAVAADLALIAAAQKVEHYEISAYHTARTMAGQIGLPQASMLLGRTLAEEEVADSLLRQIARELLSESGDMSADSEQAVPPARKSKNAGNTNTTNTTKRRDKRQPSSK